jgi:hypothetical protein
MFDWLHTRTTKMSTPPAPSITPTPGTGPYADGDRAEFTKNHQHAVFSPASAEARVHWDRLKATPQDLIEKWGNQR